MNHLRRPGSTRDSPETEHLGERKRFRSCKNAKTNKRSIPDIIGTENTLIQGQKTCQDGSANGYALKVRAHGFQTKKNLAMAANRNLCGVTKGLVVVSTFEVSVLFFPQHFHSGGKCEHRDSTRSTALNSVLKLNSAFRPAQASIQLIPSCQFAIPLIHEVERSFGGRATWRSKHQR